MIRQISELLTEEVHFVVLLTVVQVVGQGPISATVKSVKVMLGHVIIRTNRQLTPVRHFRLKPKVSEILTKYFCWQWVYSDISLQLLKMSK